MKELAPILLFSYKRLDTLHQTVSALQQNYLAKESDLFVFSDAAKYPDDTATIKKVRDYLYTIDGFKSVTIQEASQNKGLAKSIIDGVTQVINEHSKVIVLEDDLVVSKNFLSYMNQCLDFYSSNKSASNISGYSFDLKIQSDYPFDVFFNKRGCSWGWATWADRWLSIDWNLLKHQLPEEIKCISQIGTDIPSLIDKYKKEKIDSWAVIWNCHQFLNKTYTVYPIVSKVSNIGFEINATHTTYAQKMRFSTVLDIGAKKKFSLSEIIFESKKINKLFFAKFSYITRLKYKLIDLFFRSI